MNPKTFVDNYKEAFGASAEIPIAFWYSNQAIAETIKEGHCIFSKLNRVRSGEQISLNDENIGCGGGKFYCGFSEMPPYVPTFVSEKERYKEHPEQISELLEQIAVPRTSKKYLNFSRVDLLDSFDEIEGIFFYATPDVLSGLFTWTVFDNNHPDAVVTLFGSGCATVVTYTSQENNKSGNRCFIGMFDPSARKHIESNLLTFSIPMSRFKVLYETIRRSCLFDTHAWNFVHDRIEKESKPHQ